MRVGESRMRERENQMQRETERAKMQLLFWMLVEPQIK